MKQAENYTKLIRDEATRLGFDFVGFARAERLDNEADHLEAWLNRGLHGQMHYMANYFEQRLDPRKLVPDAKTVVSLLYNYYNDATPNHPDAPKMAMYAQGEDYHFVLKRKLNDLLTFITTEIGAVNGRCFVDSAPIMEREWARRSGAGWLGRNTLLIDPKRGSYFFLAELVLDVALVYDAPMRDYCGTCTRCIDACPTEAIAPEGYLLDASKCISYLTIELKEAIPTEFAEKMDGWMFGCDVCQQVCPWNRFSSKHHEPAFEPHPTIANMSKNDWEEITEDVFREVFRKSAVKRTKYSGLKRNIDFLKK